MNYSRVALLLALALVSRTADAWVINSPLMMTGERTVMAPLSSAENFWPADSFQHSAYWFADDGASANKANAQVEEELGIEQQLAALFHHGMSLLKTTSRKTIAYVSLYWQQAVAYCRDHSPKVEVEKVGLDLRATLDDLVETDTHSDPRAENQHWVDDGLWRSRSRRMPVCGLLAEPRQPSSRGTAVCENELPLPNWTNDRAVACGPVDGESIRGLGGAVAGGLGMWRFATFRANSLSLIGQSCSKSQIADRAAGSRCRRLESIER